MRGLGGYVNKLDATGNAGLPDWLLVTKKGVALVEAKKVLSKGRYAYSPKQLRAAQAFTLNAIDLHGGRAYVLVLSDEGYVLLPLKAAKRALTHEAFYAQMKGY